MDGSGRPYRMRDWGGGRGGVARVAVRDGSNMLGSAGKHLAGTQAKVPLSGITIAWLRLSWYGCEFCGAGHLTQSLARWQLEYRCTARPTSRRPGGTGSSEPAVCGCLSLSTRWHTPPGHQAQGIHGQQQRPCPCIWSHGLRVGEGLLHWVACLAHTVLPTRMSTVCGFRASLPLTRV